MLWRPISRHFFQASARVGDVSDKLSSTWSFLLLIIFAMLAYHQSFEKQPVSCWCPAEFKSSMEDYTNKVCWEVNYYYLPLRENVPYRTASRRFWKPNYKWLPLILALQALLFKFPDIFLACGQSQFGFSFHKILGLTEGYSTLNTNDRILVGKQVGRYLKNWLFSSTTRDIPWGPLTLLYLITKISYFANSVTQLALLDKFLKVENETSFASQLVNDIVNNETSEWRLANQTFPRVFLCDFFVQRVTSRQHYTVQCILNVATFYEGLYGFLWLWLMFTTLASSTSLALFGLKIMIPVFRTRFVRRYLALADDIGSPPQDSMISDFADSQITEDGIFVLKAIGEVSSEHLVRDVLVYLWNSKYRPASVDSQGSTSDIPANNGQTVLPSAPYDPSRDYGRGGAVLAPPPAYVANPDQPTASVVRINDAGCTESIPLVENRRSRGLYPSVN